MTNCENSPQTLAKSVFLWYNISWQDVSIFSWLFSNLYYFRRWVYEEICQSKCVWRRGHSQKTPLCPHKARRPDDFLPHHLDIQLDWLTHLLDDRIKIRDFQPHGLYFFALFGRVIRKLTTCGIAPQVVFFSLSDLCSQTLRNALICHSVIYLVFTYPENGLRLKSHSRCRFTSRPRLSYQIRLWT